MCEGCRVLQAVAQMKKLDEKMCEYAYSAGLLHEIGMVGIPDRLIRKDSLTDDDIQYIRHMLQKDMRFKYASG